jgi:hypothetical protein
MSGRSAGGAERCLGKLGNGVFDLRRVYTTVLDLDNRTRVEYRANGGRARSVSEGILTG